SQEQMVVGDTLNLAARLQAIAEPDTVVIAETTRRLVGGNFKLRDLGRRELKGIAAPVPVFAVAGVVDSESRFDAVHGGRSSGIVGRDAELAELLARKERAFAGQGQVVLITGEAGIGKSSLAAALCQRIAGERHVRVRYQ